METLVVDFKSDKDQLILGLAGICIPPDFLPQYFTKAILLGQDHVVFFPTAGVTENSEKRVKLSNDCNL